MMLATLMIVVAATVASAQVEDGYAEWTFAGSAGSFTGTMTLPPGFPEATFTSNSRASVGVQTGATTTDPSTTTTGDPTTTTGDPTTTTGDPPTTTSGQAPTTTAAGSALPATGSPTGALVTLGALLLVVGLGIVASARFRRDDT